MGQQHIGSFAVSMPGSWLEGQDYLVIEVIPLQSATPHSVPLPLGEGRLNNGRDRTPSPMGIGLG